MYVLDGRIAYVVIDDCLFKVNLGINKSFRFESFSFKQSGIKKKNFL